MNEEKSVGQIIRELREKKGLLVRQVAALLEVDPSLLSKIERGYKKPTKDQVKLLAKILEVKENDLLIPYLSDRIVYQVYDEEAAIEAMKVAERKIKYLRKEKNK